MELGFKPGLQQSTPLNTSILGGPDPRSWCRTRSEDEGSQVLAGPPGGAVPPESENVEPMLRGQTLYPLNIHRGSILRLALF